MMAFVQHLPAGCVWSGFGISRMEMPMLAQAMLLGGNLRVGLEDNLYLSRGEFASNAQLVDRAVGIVERLGGTVAGPATVRERLGLRGGRRGTPQRHDGTGNPGTVARRYQQRATDFGANDGPIAAVVDRHAPSLVTGRREGRRRICNHVSVLRILGFWRSPRGASSTGEPAA